jgi:hypothetical protein
LALEPLVWDLGVWNPVYLFRDLFRNQDFAAFGIPGRNAMPPSYLASERQVTDVDGGGGVG